MVATDVAREVAVVLDTGPLRLTLEDGLLDDSTALDALDAFEAGALLVARCQCCWPLRVAAVSSKGVS